MCSRGAGHDTADGAGAVPAGEAQDGATSDTKSTAILGDVPKALAERNQEYKFYHGSGCKFSGVQTLRAVALGDAKSGRRA